MTLSRDERTGKRSGRVLLYGCSAFTETILERLHFEEEREVVLSEGELRLDLSYKRDSIREFQSGRCYRSVRDSQAVVQ